MNKAQLIREGRKFLRKQREDSVTRSEVELKLIDLADKHGLDRKTAVEAADEVYELWQRFRLKKGEPVRLNLKRRTHPWANDSKKLRQYQKHRIDSWHSTYRFGDSYSCETFMSIPHEVMKSKLLWKLSDSAFRLLMYLCAQYNGNNDGELTATPEEVMHRLRWKSRQRVYRALQELLKSGAIRQVAKPVSVLPGLYEIVFPYKPRLKRKFRIKKKGGEA